MKRAGAGIGRTTGVPASRWVRSALPPLPARPARPALPPWSALLALPALLLALALPGGDAAAQTSPHGDVEAAADCVACHTPAGWTPARADMDFDHGRATDFPLNGRHSAVGCAGCHLGLRFDEPAAGAGGCGGCHVDVHQGRFPADCASCHNSTSFAASVGLEAHARTSFALTGAHAQVACEGCHRDDRAGAFAPLSTDCLACHQRDYGNAEFPDHTTLAYSADCRLCHGSLSWHAARFDHLATSGGFGLIGAHAGAPCTACHIPPDHRLQHTPAGPDDCVACHQSDYDREHAGTGFPTTCAMCHGADRWSGVSFEHDAQYFPIFSGAHRGEWRACQDCHPTPQSFTVFTCLTCHLQAKTDEKHKEENGYAYESARCLACHPAGKS